MVLGHIKFIGKLARGLFVVILAPPVLAATTAEYPWAVRGDLSQAVIDFKLNSPIIAPMRLYESPNAMVYVPSSDGDGTDDASNIALMPIYSLLACMNFTNPNSNMIVDSGGGYDINVKNASFAGGSWDADVRIIEREEISSQEGDSTLVLNKITVGNLIIETNEQRAATLKLMIAACL